MYKCKICDKLFEKKQSLGAHIVSAHTDHNKRKYIIIEKKCRKCDNVFNVKRILDKNGKEFISKKEKRFCSRKCANSHVHDNDSKNKISIGVKAKLKEYKLICDICNNEFISKSKFAKHCKNKIKLAHKANNSIKQSCLIYNLKCCLCKNNFETKNKDRKYCLPCLHKVAGSIGGKKSVSLQNRRSKNEAYFADLCKLHFKNVETNASIFNGWDADIIIHGSRIAIMWNGPWHYKKINKQHSLLQVQNRDNIKINEIKKCEYTPYVIKDLGKQCKKKVELEFTKFLQFIAGYGSGNREGSYPSAGNGVESSILSPANVGVSII